MLLQKIRILNRDQKVMVKHKQMMLNMMPLRAAVAAVPNVMHLLEKLMLLLILILTKLHHLLRMYSLVVTAVMELV